MQLILNLLYKIRLNLSIEDNKNLNRHLVAIEKYLLKK